METQSSVKMEDQRNKETVNLLDLFSDSESAVSDLVLTPRKKKFKRRYRSGSSVRVKRSNSCACGKSQSRVISLWLATILITIWLIALSWLAAILYSDIGKMNASIRAVTVPLRPPTKKMKKRKELDALAPPHAITRRNSGKRSSQELLTDSSDDRSEYWSTSTRGGRKCRSRRNRVCPGFLRACNAFLACASVLATATLIWLFIDVRQQLSALRTELDQAIAGNEGIPAELQKSQSLSKDLKNNQTAIFLQLADLRNQLANFTAQLSGVQTELHEVQKKLQAAPELVNIPKNLDALSTEFVRFGSEFGDLRVTVESLKESNSKMQNVQSTLMQNVTKIEHSLADMSNVTQQPQSVLSKETREEIDLMKEGIQKLTDNLTNANKTLSGNIEWVTEDVKKDHKKLIDLEDAAQNLSTKVISLEQERALFANETKEAQVINVDLKNRLNKLENMYNTLKNSTVAMSASITELQSSKTIGSTEDEEIVKPLKFEGNPIPTMSESVAGPTDDGSPTKMVGR